MSGMDRVLEKKKGFRTKHLWIVLASVLVIYIIHSIFFKENGKRLIVDSDRITSEKISYGVFQDFIAVQGTVEPIRTIYLDVIEGGRVEEILREEGSILKKGEPIIRLSNDNMVLDISNTEAQITRAINESRNARLYMQQQLLNTRIRIVELTKKFKQDERFHLKNKLLFEDKYISEEEFLNSSEEYLSTSELLSLYIESYRTDSLYHSAYLSSLEESVERMSRNLKLTMRRLDNLTIYAPESGELTSLKAEIGEVINYGTRVGTINILESYKLRVEIDEHYISRVFRGLEGECEFSDSKFKARVSKIYPEVRGGRFPVDMVFTDEIPDQIRIGQTTRIRLELGDSNTALLISRGGFYQSTGGKWIFVIDPSGDFALKRPISIGRQNPRYYELLEGLEEGEEVIVSSYDQYLDADRLIIK